MSIEILFDITSNEEVSSLQDVEINGVRRFRLDQIHQVQGIFEIKIGVIKINEDYSPALIRLIEVLNWMKAILKSRDKSIFFMDGEPIIEAWACDTGIAFNERQVDWDMNGVAASRVMALESRNEVQSTLDHTVQYCRREIGRSNSVLAQWILQEGYLSPV